MQQAGGRAGGVLIRLGDWADALGEGAIRRYERLLAVCLQNKAVTLVAIAVAAGLGLSLLSAVERELMPAVDRKQLVLEVEFPESSLLRRTLAEVAEIEQLLGADPAIQTVYSSVGTTDITFDPSHRPGANKAVIEVKICPRGPHRRCRGETKSLGPHGRRVRAERAAAAVLSRAFLPAKDQRFRRAPQRRGLGGTSRGEQGHCGADGGYAAFCPTSIRASLRGPVDTK